MVDVCFVTNDDLSPARTMGEQTGEVAHRAARDEDRGLLPDALSGPALELVDGWIIAEDIVSHGGGAHRSPHRGSGPGHGVGAKIDDLHAAGDQRYRRLPALPYLTSAVLALTHPGAINWSTGDAGEPTVCRRFAPPEFPHNQPEHHDLDEYTET